jgi:hypothetical protein
MDVLAETEWNFESEKLPENELLACHAHEYGREIAKQYKPISKLLETKWRYERLPKGNSERWRWVAAFDKLNDLGIPISLSFAAECDRSWYSLPSYLKKTAVKSSARDQNLERLSGLAISTIRELEPSQPSSD